MSKIVDVKKSMYRPNRRSKFENTINELEEQAKEIIKMWLNKIKKVKNRIEKLRDMENAM